MTSPQNTASPGADAVGLDRLLATALDAVRAGARLGLDPGEKLRIDTKRNRNDVVTQVDRGIEALIAERLAPMGYPAGVRRDVALLVRHHLLLPRMIACADPADPADPAEAGPLRGGRVIGYLERLAVVTTLMAGWPEGLAIILAVKSLARYPELRHPGAAEQFIIGTFVSVLWAVACAGVAVAVGR